MKPMHARHTIVLFAAGTLAAGLLLAGCGGKEGSETPTPASGGGSDFSAAAADTAGRWNTVLARVGDREITAEDVYSQMQQTVGPERAQQSLTNPDMLQVALAALVDQFVWEEQAHRDGYQLSRSEQAKVDALAAELLTTRYLGEVVQGKATPSDEDVFAWYQENQQNYLAPARVATSHILVGTEAEARALADQARGGADFRALVRQYSKDDLTRDIGGNQGWVEAGKEILGVGRDRAFENAVLPLQPGDVTVVRTQNGWHVVQVNRREGGGLRPFEEVKEDIRAALLRNRFPRVYNDELALARERAEAQLLPGGIERFTGVTRNVDRIMQMAGQAPDPGQRAELYRRVVFDFPDSRQAPEAQFLIAYTNIRYLNDSYAANKALSRLERRWPDSDWAKAGRWLREKYVDPNAPEVIGHPHDEEGGHDFSGLDMPEPQEILEQVRQ